MPSYQEARLFYIQAMGEELGVAYHLLWNRCAHLHVRWEEYVQMFGKSQDEFDIMNEVAPGFFKAVQDLSWESILLGLSRFADNAMVSGRKTLSLDGLLKIKESHAVPNLTELVAFARTKIKFAQDWRNRAIAHIDFEHEANRTALPLAPASRMHVREALAAIVVALEAVDNHFTGSSLLFMGTTFNWGGLHLLSELRLINRLRDERDKRIEAGTPSPDDLDYEKWRS